jgi:hypothetical protein
MGKCLLDAVVIFTINFGNVLGKTLIIRMINNYLEGINENV